MEKVNKTNEYIAPRYVCSEKELIEDSTLYCKEDKCYEVIGYDPEEKILTIEVEGEQWVSIREDDPNFRTVWRGETCGTKK